MGWNTYGFPERIDTILNWTELKILLNLKQNDTQGARAESTHKGLN